MLFSIHPNSRKQTLNYQRTEFTSSLISINERFWFCFSKRRQKEQNGEMTKSLVVTELRSCKESHQQFGTLKAIHESRESGLHYGNCMGHKE